MLTLKVPHLIKIPSQGQTEDNFMIPFVYVDRIQNLKVDMWSIQPFIFPWPIKGVKEFQRTWLSAYLSSRRGVVAFKQVNHIQKNEP